MTIVDQLSFSKNALSNYVKEVEKLYDSGVANEESYYHLFRDLLANYFSSEEFEVRIVPKAEETKDKPDIIVFMDEIPILHVEAKNPYDKIEKWLVHDTTNRLFDQVYRFRGREANNMPVIIIDFIYIWVIDKETQNSKEIDHQIKYKYQIIDDSESSWKVKSGINTNLESVLLYACEDRTISITRVSSMIPHLVKYAKILRDEIIKIFKNEANPMKTYLESIRTDFLDSIFSSDKEKKSNEFADLVAQTLIYGGFIAWIRYCKDGNESKDFSFSSATTYLPFGTFIYSLFSEFLVKLSPNIQNTIINKIEKTFQSSQYEKIIENTETLMVTFYSIFLWDYDIEMAKDRGIVYTPNPIVNYMVRGVDILLKNYFNKENGILNDNISFLDPAAGTMAYPIEIAKLAYDKLQEKYEVQPGRFQNSFNQWIYNSYLPNTYAFEILMAPYVLWHFRVNMILNDLGAGFNPQENRVNFHLFNTLMSSQTTLENFRNASIGEEIINALNIRANKEILVIISNPPYNISSQNKIDWIEEKMVLYKHNLDEKNIQPLSDDYVKFIRFAQWKLCETSNCQKGIVAYITNNTYLDGRIFRIMRAELCKGFDYIYITNLHGNSRKGEQGNPFDIRVGVAIIFLIRIKEHSDDFIEIYCKDIPHPNKYEKFNELEKVFNLEDFKKIEINENSLFITLEIEKEIIEKYNGFHSLDNIFINYSTGIKTHHDDFLVDIDENRLKEHLKLFFQDDLNKLNEMNAEIRESNTWDANTAKENTSYIDATNTISDLIYRGFDERKLIFDTNFVERGRENFMVHLGENNPCICTTKQLMQIPFTHTFIVNKPFDICILSTKSKESAYGFPLTFEGASNIRRLELNYEITEEDLFYYIYGILNTPIYMNRYEELLSKDFPRIPFPEVQEIFNRVSSIGRRLAKLHLLTAEDLDTTQFPMSESIDYNIYYIRKNDKDDIGNQIPDTYDSDTQKVYFKKRTRVQIKAEEEGDTLENLTWIGGITQEMWDFKIGGRQQLKEWLYSRRYSNEFKKNTIQRSLNNEELEYFLKMCDTIKKTIELLPELDEVYRKIDP